MARVGDLVSGPWLGSHRLTAGLFYSSGTYHGSWDVAMPLWTPLYALADGVIAEMATSVRNNPSGYNPGSGAPSNWRLLHFTWQGQRCTALYNHLSPGNGGVLAGQAVRRGQVIGYSGNSGNSSGPHLHLTTMRGTWWGWQRYRYLQDRSIVIYPPDQTWAAAPTAPQPSPVQPPKPPWEHDDMAALLIRGDKAPDVYSLDTVTGKRRKVEGPEFAARQAHGEPYKVLPQAVFDAIPKA